MSCVSGTLSCCLSVCPAAELSAHKALVGAHGGLRRHDNKRHTLFSLLSLALVAPLIFPPQLQSDAGKCYCLGDLLPFSGLPLPRLTKATMVMPRKSCRDRSARCGTIPFPETAAPRSGEYTYEEDKPLSLVLKGPPKVTQCKLPGRLRLLGHLHLRPPALPAVSHLYRHNLRYRLYRCAHPVQAPQVSKSPSQPPLLGV